MTKYRHMFTQMNNETNPESYIYYVSKANFLTIINEVFKNDSFHISNGYDSWSVHTEEHSVVPIDAGRFVGIFEQIFKEKVSSVSKDENGVFVHINVV